MMRLGVAIPQPAIRNSQSAVRNGLLAWERADTRNICLLLAGFALVLLLIPPMRSYPMSDDWAYAQSVERLLDLSYKPHDWAQPTSIGHVAWGALFSLFFGYGFTVLTMSTLVVSALCLGTFYTLLRHLRVAPTPALLGTALLGLNPMYLYLSYTFMTDLTFMLYVLGACLCFVRWAQGSGDRWLLLGSMATALAYLTRQHGLVLLPAMFFYLWWVRRLTWRSALMLCGVPLASVAVYMIWERTYPPQFVSHMIAMTMQQIVNDPPKFVWYQLLRGVLVLSLPGLCLLPLVAYFTPRKPLLVLPVWLFFLFFQVRSLIQYGTVFPTFGNLVDHGGLVMYDYDTALIWTEHVWLVLGIIGASVMSLYIMSVAGEVWRWVQGRRAIKAEEPALSEVKARRSGDPAIIVYAAGLLLAILTFASPFLFDRYVLQILPMMMLLPLRRMSTASITSDQPGIENGKEDPASLRFDIRRLSPSAVVAASIVPIALFSLLAMRDYRAHSEVRWQAAEQLIAQGARYDQVSAGYEWVSWYIFLDGVTGVRQLGEPDVAHRPNDVVLDPVYLVGEWVHQGYIETASVPYDCWLCGGQTRRLVIQERQGR